MLTAKAKKSETYQTDFLRRASLVSVVYGNNFYRTSNQNRSENSRIWFIHFFFPHLKFNHTNPLSVQVRKHRSGHRLGRRCLFWHLGRGPRHWLGCRRLCLHLGRACLALLKINSEVQITLFRNLHPGAFYEIVFQR